MNNNDNTERGPERSDTYRCADILTNRLIETEVINIKVFNLLYSEDTDVPPEKATTRISIACNIEDNTIKAKSWQQIITGCEIEIEYLRRDHPIFNEVHISYHESDPHCEGYHTIVIEPKENIKHV